MNFVIALAITGAFVVPAVRWPTVGRWMVALLFFGGAAFNTLYTLPGSPGTLEGLVATSYVPLYTQVIDLVVAWEVSVPFALLVIAFELAVGVSVLSGGLPSRLGLLAAAAWSLGMLPVIPRDGLLIGAALTGAPGVAALMLLRRPGRLVPVPSRRVLAAGAVVAALFGLYGTVLYPWLLNWGSTSEEQRMALPGDHLLPDPSRYFTRAISIDAPPPVVWHWIMQIGQDRAGFYSNDYLENLAGGDIHNVDELRPEWQARAVGERVPMARTDIAGGAVGEALYLPILAIEPERMVTNLPGRFVLLPTPTGGTRLLLREPLNESLFVKLVYEPMHFVMEQRMLRGIKERAEGRALVAPPVRAAAQIGWVLAGAAVGGLFLSRRRWLPWGAACAALMVPSWHSTGDLSGALAGFLALGITTLGALHYGRRWMAPYALVAAVVLLTLLLSPDSYSVFGLTLLALTVGATGMWAVRHMKARPVDVYVRPA